MFIEVERDDCVGGDEAVFGGGKVIRESMGQSRATRADGAPDLVITGAVVVDHWGIVKADIGVREGRIVGSGTGPAERSKATTVTPGAWNLARMLESLDQWPVNVALLAKGNTVSTESLWEQLRGGAAGFKLHEDRGTTPAAIDACLRVADDSGVQVAIHTDTVNEAGFVETTMAAIAGRSIHTFHTEGAGGGHAPDIMTVESHPNVLPSSTNPTRPHTVNTVAEHLDMLMACHHLNPAVAEDLAFAESRLRPSTIAAEDVLHDLGAISMIGSDSQAMGRIGKVIMRTWQTAHVMKRRRGRLAGDSRNDNNRVRRYVAKYRICPAVAHGLDADRQRLRCPGSTGHLSRPSLSSGADTSNGSTSTSAGAPRCPGGRGWSSVARARAREPGAAVFGCITTETWCATRSSLPAPMPPAGPGQPRSAGREPSLPS